MEKSVHLAAKCDELRNGKAKSYDEMLRVLQGLLRLLR
jgi:hypothetical protein